MPTPAPRAVVLAAALGAALVVASVARAEIGADLVADGFSQSLFVTSAPTDASTLFVVEKAGVIKTVDRDTGAVTSTFLDINGLIDDAGEQGLLGLAFAPDYATSGEFYVHYNNNNDDTTIARYRRSANPLVADTTGQVVFTATQTPQTNHKGGWMGFSPVDGNLYLALGDGGNRDDTGAGHNPTIGNAQDLASPLGKILRLDVSGSDFTRTFEVPSDNPFVGVAGAEELIYAYGLRNPFRSSFDRDTGDLYIGDVGQDFREEIDLLPAGQSGWNFGWRNREGYLATPTGGVGTAREADNIDPIFDYAQSSDMAGDRPILGSTVTGGYVYRGDLLGPAYEGKYFFADFGSDRIFVLDIDPTEALDVPADFFNLENLDLEFTEITSLLFPAGNPGGWDSFGEDANGELYLVSIGGDVYAIVPEPSSALALAGMSLLALRRRR